MKVNLVQLYEVDENTALLVRKGDSVGYLVRLIPGEEWTGFPADARALVAGRVDPQWTAVELDRMSEGQPGSLLYRQVAEWCDGVVREVGWEGASIYVDAYTQGATMVTVWLGRTPLAEAIAKRRRPQRPGRACARRRRRKWNLPPRDRRGLLAYHVLTAARLAWESEAALRATLDGPGSWGAELRELLKPYRDYEEGPLVHPLPSAIVDRLERAELAARALREEANEAASVVLAALGYGAATLEGQSVLDRLSDAFRVIRGEESASVEALSRMSREVEDRARRPVGGGGDGV
jgi:hypothetical protein